MKLTNDDKLAASIAMKRGDSFTRGNATMFPFGCTAEYCVLQMIGPADKCKRVETTSWTEALEKFEEFADAEYQISGIVNVAMYQSILDPNVAMSDEKYDESAWDNFDPDKYTALVLERAVIELKSLLEMLPDEQRCEYVEGSAEIRANYSQNILDRLYFKVVNSSGVTEKALQDYLTTFFLPDWEDEFGAQYRIYEYIAMNYTPASFPREEALA